MPTLRNYDLMISHAWTYGDDYDRIVNLLNSAPNFQWRNLSVPKDDPIHAQGARALATALDDRVRRVHAMLVLSGVYASHSDWMQRELEMANGYGKPIVSIKPWGNQRSSAIVDDAAIVLVNWNTDSIVSAIRQYAL